MSFSCLVTGAAGQVGKELQEADANFEGSVSYFDKKSLDITKYHQVEETLKRVSPCVVINAAAYTNVDGAEKDPVAAMAVNRDGAENLAKICQGLRIPLIHISTDFVFDGVENKSYFENDATSPLSIYGKSKLEGERAVRNCLQEHIILRTAWVFSRHGKNFVKSIFSAANQNKELRVVDDQIGCPTAASDIAEALFVLANRVTKSDAPWGRYHFCSGPAISRFEFAIEIIECCRDALGSGVDVFPVSTAEYPVLASRPAHAVLDCSLIYKTFGIEPPTWRQGLEKVCRSLQQD